MNGHEALMVAIAAALRGHAPIARVVTGVFEAPPGRAMRPYLLIDEPMLADWSTKDQIGREARLTIQVRDSGECRRRVRALAGEVETAITAMPRALAGNWRLASLVPIRSRIMSEREHHVVALMEFRARMLRAA